MTKSSRRLPRRLTLGGLYVFRMAALPAVDEPDSVNFEIELWPEGNLPLVFGELEVNAGTYFLGVTVAGPVEVSSAIAPELYQEALERLGAAYGDVIWDFAASAARGMAAQLMTAKVEVPVETPEPKLRLKS